MEINDIKIAMDNQDKFYDIMDKYANKLLEAQMKKGARWLDADEMSLIQTEMSAHVNTQFENRHDDYNEHMGNITDENPIRRRILMYSFDHATDCSNIGKPDEHLLDHEILDIFEVCKLFK